MSVKYNGTYYYYLYNGQGDVVKLIDGDGVTQVEYTYDTWGACSVTGSLANTLGAKNPFRYRGYVYDTETRLYYLESRYYDPETGRFISADTLMSTGQSALGYNMFAYCGNNPVVRKDSEGTFWHLIVGAVVGVATQYVADVVSNLASGKSFSESLKPTSSWADYGSAAVSGALAASGIGVIGSVAANAALGGATYVANCQISGETVNGADFLVSVGIGGIAGAIGGNGVAVDFLLGLEQEHDPRKDLMQPLASQSLPPFMRRPCSHLCAYGRS